ncbi:unnamed protein product [marine sediment metagenome]|uniref:Uncharacterized protein n=1 Tax=marine sediment metagenome TaxID=412755 RepID=X1E0Q7_9ZZZZ
MNEIRPFSESISTGSDQIDSVNPISDSFATITSPITRRILYTRWMGLSDDQMEKGFQNIEDKTDLYEIETKVEKATEKAFAGQDITDDEINMLKVGWPEFFKNVKFK